MNTTSDKAPLRFVVLGSLLLAAIVLAWWLWNSARLGGDVNVGTSGIPPATASVGNTALIAPVVSDVAQASSEVADEPPPADFAGLLARYGPEQRRILEAYYEPYDDRMMQFSTPEQLTWLKRRGFPMPEDVLAARFRSDEQLLAQAKAGDAMAAALLLERSMARVTSRETMSDQLFTLTQNLPRAMASGSPFAGYLYARHEALAAEVGYAENTTTAARLGADAKVVGWYWSRMLGDTRAPAIVGFLGGSEIPAGIDYVPGLDYGEAYIPLWSFWRILDRSKRINPDLFANAEDKWPRAPKD